MGRAMERMVEIDYEQIANITRTTIGNLLSRCSLYRNFINRPHYNDLLEIVTNECYLEQLVDKNSEGIPPVETLLKLLDENSINIGIIDSYYARQMGYFIRLIFTDIMQYDIPMRRRKIKYLNNHGIGSAYLYDLNNE